MKTPFEEVFDAHTALSVTLMGVVDESIGVDVYNKIAGQVGDSVGSAVHNDVEGVINE